MRRQPLLICLSLFSVMLCVSAAQAIVLPAVAETEPNDSFFEREILPAGINMYTGTITPGEFFGGGEHQQFGEYDLYIKFGTTNPLSLVTGVGELATYNGLADIERSGELFPGDVDFFSFGELTPNQPFVAIIDNTVSDEGSFPDTVLGWMNSPNPFDVIDVDDASSPLGNGVASSLSGTVDSSGNLHLAVSGFDDFDFDGFGDDGEGGCDSELCEGEEFEGGDVDFVTFTGLTPGEFFIAETDTTFDSVLGLFGNEGNWLAFNDDSGEGLNSALGGLVPGDGTLHLAVSGFNDRDFFGNHGEEGDYTLEVQTAPLGSGELEIGDFVIAPSEIVDGEFLFNDLFVVDGIPVRLDPAVAIGYEYAIDGGGIMFGTVQLPALVNDTEYELSFTDENGVLVTIAIAAGDIYDFTLLAPGGVTEFAVNGIDVGAMLDPTDPFAFLTVITTVGTGTVTISQNPITIPEPATLLLITLGVGIATCGRRRQS